MYFLHACQDKNRSIEFTSGRITNKCFVNCLVKFLNGNSILGFLLKNHSRSIICFTYFCCLILCRFFIYLEGVGGGVIFIHMENKLFLVFYFLVDNNKISQNFTRFSSTIDYIDWFKKNFEYFLKIYEECLRLFFFYFEKTV